PTPRGGRRAGWVLAAWLLVTGVLNTAVPQLEEVVAKDSTPVVPLDAPSAVATDLMDPAFGSGRSTSFLVVVAERTGGLTADDKRYLRRLVPQLRADPDDVTFVQDIR
ncbi:MMPL family transporter, partial [Nocardioides sp. R-C-SC26]|uniref:MMPL family transporter n=1 Tax=Nocardioides sp. R-C-SC26 TaxID=2870414 RepID=UPI001E3D7E2F